MYPRDLELHNIQLITFLLSLREVDFTLPTVFNIFWFISGSLYWRWPATDGLILEVWRLANSEGHKNAAAKNLSKILTFSNNFWSDLETSWQKRGGGKEKCISSVIDIYEQK